MVSSGNFEENNGNGDSEKIIERFPNPYQENVEICLITTVLSDFEENFNEPMLQGEVILKEGEEETLLRTYIYDYYTWTTSGKLSCKWISETEVPISGYIIYDYQ